MRYLGIGLIVVSAAASVFPAFAQDKISVGLSDSNSRRVYALGQEISATAHPVVSLGADLKASIAELAVLAEPKAHELKNADDPARILLDGKLDYGHELGVMADFWGAKSPGKALVINVKLKSPVRILTVEVFGKNMNGEYSIEKGEIEAWNGDERKTVQLYAPKRDGEWKLDYHDETGFAADRISVRLSANYKINVTELSICGVALDKEPFPASFGNACKFFARWKDWHGRELAPAKELPVFKDTKLAFSPSSPGYYGLVIDAERDGVCAFKKEYGFFVGPKDLSALSSVPPAVDSPFGMVHHDIDDSFLKVRWIKTLSADGKMDSENDVKSWKGNIDVRRKKGMEEVVLFASKFWKSDATKPVEPEALAQLKEVAENYFKAQPDVLFWELGLEENLGWRGHKAEWSFFWPNLAAKAKAVREAAGKLNPEIKLIYQIAELDYPSIEAFFKSEAHKQFDILSLHPYAWSRFPSPDSWMEKFLDRVKMDMQAAKHEGMPVWFTEIGAPHNGNPGGFFGYPGNKFVRGVERDEAAAYMVKCHCIAIGEGVERVFWYNYKDRGSDPAYPEDHFGLVDHWGYPKPVYGAYYVLSSALNGKKLVLQSKERGVYAYKFEAPDGACCLVAWDSNQNERIGLKDLQAKFGIPGAQSLEASDMLGGPLAAERLEIASEPVLLSWKGASMAR